MQNLLFGIGKNDTIMFKGRTCGNFKVVDGKMTISLSTKTSQEAAKKINNFEQLIEDLNSKSSKSDESKEGLEEPIKSAEKEKAVEQEEPIISDELEDVEDVEDVEKIVEIKVVSADFMKGIVELEVNDNLCEASFETDGKVQFSWIQEVLDREIIEAQCLEYLRNLSELEARKYLAEGKAVAELYKGGFLVFPTLNPEDTASLEYLKASRDDIKVFLKDDTVRE